MASSGKCTEHATRVECGICDEPCNKTSRKEFACPKCQEVFCRSCVRQNILSTVNDPVCPACKHPMDNVLIKHACGASWFTKEHKQYRMQVLFDREKAKLAGDMEAVAQYKQYIDTNNRAKSLMKKASIMRKQILDVNREVDELFAASRRHEQMALGTIRKNNKWEFNHPCPYGGCLGFLSKVGKCPLCENWTCLKCFEIKGNSKTTEHTCKEENVASAQHIKKHTKRCPECGVPCVRISGCTQMWCPECHTSFSYRTGEVYKNPVHNPEREKWIREGMVTAKRKRKSADIGGASASANQTTCNHAMVIVPFITFHTAVNNVVEDKNTRSALIQAHGPVYHLEGLMQRLRSKIQVRTSTKRLRFNYLVGEINEETIKATLERNERIVFHLGQVLGVLDTLYQVMAESMHEFVRSTDLTDGPARHLLQQYNRMIDFTVARFKEIHTTNKLAVPRLRGMYFRYHV